MRIKYIYDAFNHIRIFICNRRVASSPPPPHPSLCPSYCIYTLLISLLSKYINHIIFHIYPFRCRRRRMFIKQSKYIASPAQDLLTYNRTTYMYKSILHNFNETNLKLTLPFLPPARRRRT